jgi:hypothetical protein
VPVQPYLGDDDADRLLWLFQRLLLTVDTAGRCGYRLAVARCALTLGALIEYGIRYPETNNQVK